MANTPSPMRCYRSALPQSIFSVDISMPCAPFRSGRRPDAKRSMNADAEKQRRKPKTRTLPVPFFALPFPSCSAPLQSPSRPLFDRNHEPDSGANLLFRSQCNPLSVEKTRKQDNKHRFLDFVHPPRSSSGPSQFAIPGRSQLPRLRVREAKLVSRDGG